MLSEVVSLKVKPNQTSIGFRANSNFDQNLKRNQPKFSNTSENRSIITR